MRFDGTSALLMLGAFAVPLAASQAFTGNLTGRGQGIPNAGEAGTLRGMTLGLGMATALYALASGSKAATAIAVGLVGSSATMFVLPAPQHLNP